MSDNSVTRTGDDANRDAELESVIADYIRACDGGGSPDQRLILDRHPELADDLRDFFANRDQLDRMARPFVESESHARFLTPPETIRYFGDYEVLEEIGRGGMGVIYKAKQKSLDRVVALKMMMDGRLQSPQDVQRFRMEAESAASLDHPNIVPIYEVGEHDSRHYFSMKLVEGGSLRERIRNEPVPLCEAARLIEAVAQAVHYAHQRGILHRDLKPANILLEQVDGRGLRVEGKTSKPQPLALNSQPSTLNPLITDFGLARRFEQESELTQSGAVLGTPSYMAPEQASGHSHSLTTATDVYGLGAILYALLTGRPPFVGETPLDILAKVKESEPQRPSELNPLVDRDLETICLKCLEKEPTRRYASAAALADDLGCFLRGEPIAARPISRPARLWRWCKRNPVVAGLSTAMVMLLAGTAFVTTLGYFREAKLRDDADLARGKMERSYRELQGEQLRTSQLQQDVSELETRRQELNASLIVGEEKLSAGAEKLYDTYLRLARAAWRAENVELADYYLNQCPEHWRKSTWHDLKHLCFPKVVTFDGQRLLALSDDGKLLAAVTDKSVRVWDVVTRRVLHTLNSNNASVDALDFNPDGNLLAIGDGRRLTIWELHGGTVWRTLERHQFDVTDIEFSPDGKQLASASANEVLLWNLHGVQRTQSLPGRRYVVFNHDGQYLATSRSTVVGKQRYGGLAVWNLSADLDERRSPWFVLEGVAPSCRPVFHPFKNELAAGNSHGGSAVEFWDVDSKQVLRRFTGELSVDSLAYSPDGKRLAYAGRTAGYAYRPFASQTVIWNLITREKERTLPLSPNGVTKIAFTPQGRGLAAADSEVIKLWDVTPPPDPTNVILDDVVQLKVGQFDWPQWGGSRARVNTPYGKNIPTTWDLGDGRLVNNDGQGGNDPNWKGGARLVGSKNIKWVAQLGSESYGNPIVANGKIFLGTNNGSGYLKRYPNKIDLGVLLCFEESTGKFLWQHSNEKLPTGRVHDWPNQGVCSTPVVDGDRLWYVSNRGEVVCLDTEGFLDGEDDGPVQNEWVTLFRVEALMHGRFSYFGLPEQVRTGFTTAGVILPKQFSITQEKDTQSWSIHEIRLNQAGQRLPDGPPLYRVQLVGDKLRVTQAGTDGDLKELFSVNNHLLADLGTEKVVFALRERLANAGIQLLTESAPVTVTPGQVWTFSGLMNGREQRFQVRAEGTLLAIDRQLSVSEKDEADVVWKFNMMTELGVSQHNMANCSMLTVDGMLFVCTSNGVDDSHVNIPNPEAPSFIALDRDTGKVIWTDNSPGKNILHAQWGSPSYGVFDGSRQVMFPGGDGWLYSFDPHGDGQGGSKLLWKFDGNPKTSQYSLTGRSTRNHIIAFPAIYDGLVYIVMGEDPEHGEGTGHLWCIDPTKRIDGSDVSSELAVNQLGQIIPHRRLQAVDLTKGEKAVPNPNSAVVWHYSHQDQDGDGAFKFEEMFHRSMSIPVIKDDVLYVADFSGLFHCLNAKTGKVYWTYDMLAACWCSALLVDGKVYICDEDGDVTIFRHSADPRVAMKPVQKKDGKTEFVPINADGSADLLEVSNMGSAIYMTPIVANNVLYIATRNSLFAIESGHEFPVSSVTPEMRVQPKRGPIPASESD